MVTIFFIHIAAWNGHIDILKELLDRGADEDVKNIHGETAFEISLLTLLNNIFYFFTYERI